MRILLLILILLASCSPKKPDTTSKVQTTGEIVTGAEIKAFMGRNNIRGLRGDMVLDAKYLIPTKEWLLYDFSKQFLQYCIDNKLMYEKGSMDCDNFSLESYNMVQRLHYHNSARPPETSVLFGVFAYHYDNDSNHMINFTLIKEAGKLKIMFIEPQNKISSGNYKIGIQERKLTVEEVLSCEFWML